MNRPRFISSSLLQSVRHFISYVPMGCSPLPQSERYGRRGQKFDKSARSYAILSGNESHKGKNLLIIAGKRMECHC